MSRRRLALAMALLLVAAAGTAAALRYGPAALFALALARPAVEPWQAPLLPSVTREEVTLAAPRGALAADLYRPPRPRRAILLVHGLSAAGRRQPDLARLARRLAAHGQLVLVPHFPGLAAFRLDEAEVEEVQAALDHLAARGLPLAVAGLSFGAGPALLAAAARPDVRLAASFGGYADLRHVIAFVTTGAHAFGGRRFARRQEAYNRWKLLGVLVGFTDDPRDRATLEAIARRRLADPAGDTGPLEAGLGHEGRAVLALVRNRSEARVEPLLARLPARARAALDRLSPLPRVARLRGRLLIAHGRDDDSIPFTESLRLAEAAGARAVVLETFHHTGPRPLLERLGPGARDAWRLVRLTDALLGFR